MGPIVPPLTDGETPLLRGSCCPLTPLTPPLLLPPPADTDTGVPATEWARRCCTIPAVVVAVAVVAAVVDDDDDDDDDSADDDAAFALAPS